MGNFYNYKYVYSYSVGSTLNVRICTEISSPALKEHTYFLMAVDP